MKSKKLPTQVEEIGRTNAVTLKGIEITRLTHEVDHGLNLVQVNDTLPRVLILDGISRRVYEDLHMDEFKHQLEDNLWIEEELEEQIDEQLNVTVQRKVDLIDAHIASLILLIDQFTEELHPIRQSNSYKFLKKKFEL
jgi:hypothetical protein